MEVILFTYGDLLKLRRGLKEAGAYEFAKNPNSLNSEEDWKSDTPLSGIKFKGKA